MRQKFSISALKALNGWIGICPLPGRWGAFEKDMKAVLIWNPTLVISMTEPAEIEAHNAEKLPGLLEQEGIDWCPFPIRDFQTPHADIAEQWREISDIAQRELSDGGNVLVHCKGGCGRSGMVALRLMIKIGEAPDAALKRLRAHRPCAVETDAQMRWALSVQC